MSSQTCAMQQVWMPSLYPAHSAARAPPPAPSSGQPGPFRTPRHTSVCLPVCTTLPLWHRTSRTFHNKQYTLTTVMMTKSSGTCATSGRRLEIIRTCLRWVQEMSSAFTVGFLRWLDDLSPCRCAARFVAVAWAAVPKPLLHFPMFYDAHATPADTLLSIYNADTTKFSCAFGGIR